MNLSGSEKRDIIERLEKKLVEKIGISFKVWAKVIPRAEGKCEYCGRELVESFYKYETAHVDHLLPKSCYSDLEDNSDNWVFSCAFCNSVKGKFDCLRENEKRAPEKMIRSKKRKMLIERVYSECIRKGASERKDHWEKVREICKDTWSKT